MNKKIIIVSIIGLISLFVAVFIDRYQTSIQNLSQSPVSGSCNSGIVSFADNLKNQYDFSINSFQPNNSGNAVNTIVDEGPQVVQEYNTNPETEKQPGRKYPLTDGKTFQIVPARKYVCEDSFWGESRYQETLKVKVDNKWKEVYQTKDEGDNKCSQALVLGDQRVQVSPLGDYALFDEYGWEWSITHLLNIKTKQSVLEKDTHLEELFWSKSGKNFTFVSVLEEFGGTGRDAVWVSQYNNPDKAKAIFDLSQWAPGVDNPGWMYSIDDLKFINSHTIEFLISRTSEYDNTQKIGDVAKYRYDLESKKMQELFRKKD